MKTLIKYFCLILFITNISIPQWRWMNPTPQGNKLNDVTAIGSGKFISIGNLGTIIRTEGSRNTNTIIDNQYGNNLIKITRTSDGTLISVGQNGIILISSNEGISWQKINTQFNETFMDVCFINNSVGYIISYEGKILSTLDGGFNWTQQNNPVISNLFSISMASENVGYISGNRGLILKTTDSGNNWQKLSPLTSVNIIKIQAVDENNIFCVNINDSLYKSTNGGNDWNCILGIYRSGFKDIHFITPEIGFIVGASAVYRTSNGSYFTMVLETEGFDFFTSIDYYDTSNAFIVGNRGLMLKSTNGGFDWQHISENIFTSPYNTTPQYIKFINDITGLVMNSNPPLLRTSDGGRHWITMGTNFNYINNADFLDDEFGIAVGSSGGIFKTTNFGELWTNQSVENNYINLYAVEILDEDTAVAVGSYSSSSAIFRSTSSGNYWIIVPVTTSECLFDVSFWGIEKGIAVGENGLILKTENAGKNWLQVPFVNDHRINTVECVGLDTLFLLVSQANIYKSTDGGGTFFMLPFNISGGIRQIQFKNSNLGVAVGPNGQVFKTTDGGLSWTDLSYRSYESADIIEIISEDQFAVGSSSGNLLMYGGNITSINNQEIEEIPADYMLYQNYPNPFNPSTTIKYAISNKQLVQLKVYDILGKEIATLVNEEKPAGNYKVEFKSTVGSLQLASGIYFYRLQAGSFVETKKMILLK